VTQNADVLKVQVEAGTDSKSRTLLKTARPVTAARQQLDMIRNIYGMVFGGSLAAIQIAQPHGRDPLDRSGGLRSRERAHCALDGAVNHVS
jgi:hypothetical protein